MAAVESSVHRRAWFEHIPWLTYGRRLGFTGFFFVLPALIYFTLFAFYPMANAVRLSFYNYNLLSPPRWIGFGNYEFLFGSREFVESLGTTIIYAFGISVPIWVLSMILALMLNQNIRLRTFFRTVFFAPIVMPLVVLAIIWSLLYHPFGPINTVLLAPFINQTIPWLNSNQHALLAVIILAVWRATGYYGVIYLAGLQNIPNEYYEAARLDGANNWQLFRFITFPLLRPTTLFVVVVSIINALRHFDVIWIMTGGGPGDATRVLSVLIYETGWIFLRMGRAAAMSVILFLLALSFTVVQMWFFRTQE
ncbi:MAG: sugar ABC transporter permease [Chloroflexi bacterium]|nr:sugar ABC transporter permease [Chloroflexota bacterium]